VSQTLFAFLVAKFSEPSTHRGLAALFAAIGLGGSTWLGFNPDVVSGLYTVAGIYFGAVEIIRSERA
jgi:hypothetical protein